MIECPECGQHVKGRKCKCGWSVPQREADKQERDWNYGQCDWVADGRCRYPGVFQHGSKWFCRHHDGCSDPILGAQIVEQSKADVPVPDYSYEARKRASEAATLRQMNEWADRFSTGAA